MPDNIAVLEKWHRAYDHAMEIEGQPDLAASHADWVVRQMSSGSLANHISKALQDSAWGIALDDSFHA